MLNFVPLVPASGDFCGKQCVEEVAMVGVRSVGHTFYGSLCKLPDVRRGAEGRERRVVAAPPHACPLASLLLRTRSDALDLIGIRTTRALRCNSGLPCGEVLVAVCLRAQARDEECVAAMSFSASNGQANGSPLARALLCVSSYSL